MNMEDMIMNEVRKEVNTKTIEAIEAGMISIDDEIIPAFLAANIISNPQIIDIFKAVNTLIMQNMEKEYVDFFLEKVRELANKEGRF